MVRGLSLRERRLVEVEKKKDAGEGSSAQTLAQNKGKGKVTGSTATTPRPTPVSRPPSSLQKHQEGNLKRKADTQDAGKRVEAASKKKAKGPSAAPTRKEGATSAATASEPTEAPGSPAEWFSRLVCAGESMPKSSELRHSSEYNDIVRLNCQMIARVNKLTARYEKDVAQAEGEACRARSELEEEKAVYKASERSLHDQMSSIKEECKLMVGSKDAELSAKKNELADLKEKLRGFEESKARMEAAAKEKAWEGINSFLSARFRTIRDCLEMLRGETTMDFVNYSQAKNNLEFIEEACQNSDITVSSEKKKLREEMARYADSEAKFDQVLDEIEGELSFLPVSSEKTAPLESERTNEPEPAGAEAAGTTLLDDNEARSSLAVVESPLAVFVPPEVRPETERTLVEAEQTQIPAESEVEADEALAKVAEASAR